MNIEQSAIKLTQELIAIPSESSKPTQSDISSPEKAVNDHLASFAITRGIDFELQEVTPERSNFVAHFPQKNKPKLLIIAHTDTVSAQGMTDGFAGKIADNKIWGRGACDDKGPLAAAFCTLTGLFRQGEKLAYDTTFVATVDEETSMAGSLALSKHISPFDLCIGLEPTELKLINAHKGVHRCSITTKGLAAHSSSPEKGNNAIIAMHAIMSDLQVLEFRLKRQRDTALGRSSLAITQIQGGTSSNIIPDRCEITVDTRLLPSQDPDLYTKQLEQLVASRGEVSNVFYARGIQTDIDPPPINRLLQAIAEFGYSAEPQIAPYSTDCSQLSHKGPCVVWGPGSIADAHQPDEHIEIKQIEDTCRILQLFLTTKV